MKTARLVLSRLWGFEVSCLASDQESSVSWGANRTGRQVRLRELSKVLYSVPLHQKYRPLGALVEFEHTTLWFDVSRRWGGQLRLET